jgi:hypothetical protein
VGEEDVLSTGPGWRGLIQWRPIPHANKSPAYAGRVYIDARLWPVIGDPDIEFFFESSIRNENSQKWSGFKILPK